MSPDMPFKPTQEIKANILIPITYTCDRCGATNVGYMDVHNDAFIGFYHFAKRPSGAPAHVALAKFRRRVVITNRRVKNVLQYNAAMNRKEWTPTDEVEDFEEERDEITVCAGCLHADPLFVSTYAIPPPAMTHIPLGPMPARPGLPGRHRVKSMPSV